MRRSLAAFPFAIAIALVTFGGGTLLGQAPGGQSKKQAIARTADGQPDLQGTWDFRTITPMERPSDLASKQVLSDQEAAEFEVKHQRNQDDRTPTPAGVSNGTATNLDLERAYNDFWWDFGKKVVSTKRTSLVIDPPDGRIPALTPAAKERAAAVRAARERTATGPEDRGVSERCILGFNAGPPMVPSAYNNNVQIFQAAGYVALLNEMVHNSRIIPLDGRPHLPQSVGQWSGDSRGHWEGGTLVVDTTNFRGETAFPNSSPTLHLTERFTRVDRDTLIYEFTADDPHTWAGPWTAQIPMTKAEGSLYEYACHEGNYGMMNLLKAARSVDSAGTAAARSQTPHK
jgi:hypothetical protein